jgi:heme o synthase
MNTRADAETLVHEHGAATEPSAAREAVNFAVALWQLSKPGITRMVLIMAGLGAVLAQGPLQLVPTFFTLLGTVLIVGSANALNMVIEHDVDGLMQRTKDRPLPSGRLAPDVALSFGVALGVLGVMVLLSLVNPLTALLGVFSHLAYVLWYTPLKAKSSLALYVGAIPGAMPPVLGYVGVSGQLTWHALALFVVMFVWQVPHFLAITLFRRDEYAAAGLQVMSVEHGLAATRTATIVSAFACVLFSLAPSAVGLGGAVYFWVALVSGLAFACFALWGQRGRTLESWARSVFFASLPYLVLLFGVLAATAP